MNMSPGLSAAARMAATGPLPAGHPAVRPRKVGVLLSNLGTPDATDYWSMRRYLSEFLSDRRVIETPRILWWLILNLVILTIRPGRKGKDYDTIWNRALNESPLKTTTRNQATRLQASLDAGLLGAAGQNVVVEWGMRYGNPSIKSALDRLHAAGCDRILLVPLYPQYAAATSATACDKTFEALMTMRWQPALRVAPAYHDDPIYIEALARSVTAHLAALDTEPEVILASFHGVPQEYLTKGDPYHCQCLKTGRLLREKLGMSSDKFRVTFQSRFGPAQWLQPYTDETVKALAAQGVKRVSVVTPGIFGRLPGDDRGDRRRKRRIFQARRWRGLQPHRLPERQRRRNARDRGHRHPRIDGLGRRTGGIRGACRGLNRVWDDSASKQCIP